MSLLLGCRVSCPNVKDGVLIHYESIAAYQHVMWILNGNGKIIVVQSQDVIVNKQDVKRIFNQIEKIKINIQEEILSRSEILDLR